MKKWMLLLGAAVFGITGGMFLAQRVNPHIVEHWYLNDTQCLNTGCTETWAGTDLIVTEENGTEHLVPVGTTKRIPRPAKAPAVMPVRSAAGYCCCSGQKIHQYGGVWYEGGKEVGDHYEVRYTMRRSAAGTDPVPCP